MNAQLSSAAFKTLGEIAEKYGRYRSIEGNRHIDSEYDPDVLYTLADNGLLEGVLWKRLTDKALEEFPELFINGPLGNKEDSIEEKRWMEYGHLTLSVCAADMQALSGPLLQEESRSSVIDRISTRTTYSFLPLTERLWKGWIDKALNASTVGELGSAFMTGRDGWRMGVEFLRKLNREQGGGFMLRSKQREVDLNHDVLMEIEKGLHLRDYPHALRNLQMDAAKIAGVIKSYGSLGLAIGDAKLRKGFVRGKSCSARGDMGRDEQMCKIFALYAIAGISHPGSATRHYVSNFITTPELAREKLSETAYAVINREAISGTIHESDLYFPEFNPTDNERLDLVNELKRELLKVPGKDLEEIRQVHEENVRRGLWEGPDLVISDVRSMAAHLALENLNQSVNVRECEKNIPFRNPGDAHINASSLGR